MAQQNGKAALLTWCKNVTTGYPNVRVENFHTSWRDGLAFCAIVHYHKPDRLDFYSLSPKDPLKNNQLAFEIAASLGVPALLDAEDMLIGDKPEQFSVITYLSQMYHVFAKGADSKGRGGLAGIESGTNPTVSSPQNKPSVTPKTNNSHNQPNSTNKTQVKSNTSRGNRGTMTAPNCAKCEKKLFGDIIEWNSSIYHANCFSCTKCNKTFTKACLNINGQPYCESCGKNAILSQRDINNQPAKPSPNNNYNKPTPNNQFKSSPNEIKPTPNQPKPSAYTPNNKPTSNQPKTSAYTPNTNKPTTSNQTKPSTYSPNLPSQPKPSYYPNSPNTPNTPSKVNTTQPTKQAISSPVIKTNVQEPKFYNNKPPTSTTNKDNRRSRSLGTLNNDGHTSPPTLPNRSHEHDNKAIPTLNRSNTIAQNNTTQQTKPKRNRAASGDLNTPFTTRSARIVDVTSEKALDQMQGTDSEWTVYSMSDTVARAQTYNDVRENDRTKPVSNKDNMYTNDNDFSRFTVKIENFSFDEYQENTTLQGWLKKKDMKMLGLLSLGSKQQWFNLRAERLVYWLQKPHPGECPEGVISLRYCQNVLPVGANGEFHIVLSERTYELEAENAEKRDIWIKGINFNIQFYHKLQEHVQEEVSFGISSAMKKKEGLMDVKSTLFGWTQHHLVMVDGMLFVFFSKGGSRLYKIPLYGCSIEPWKVTNASRFAFALKTISGVTYAFSSTNLDEMVSWKVSLQTQINFIENTINQITL